MTLDPDFIKQLLSKPERQPSQRTKRSKTITRDIDTWFNLNRELGSIIDGECTVEDCAGLADERGRKRVTVAIPIDPITTIRMCRKCFLAGRGISTKGVTDLDKS